MRVCCPGTPLERERFPETFIFIEGDQGSLELGPDFWVRLTTREGTTLTRCPPPRYSWADPAYVLGFKCPVLLRTLYACPVHHAPDDSGRLRASVMLCRGGCLFVCLGGRVLAARAALAQPTYQRDDGCVFVQVCVCVCVGVFQLLVPSSHQAVTHTASPCPPPHPFPGTTSCMLALCLAAPTSWVPSRVRAPRRPPGLTTCRPPVWCLLRTSPRTVARWLSSRRDGMLSIPAVLQ